MLHLWCEGIHMILPLSAGDFDALDYAASVMAKLKDAVYCSVSAHTEI